MTGFEQRMAVAKDHEQAVAARLRSSGWEVCDFGQAQLTVNMREALRKINTPLRWMPDLLAVMADEVILIDAKSEMNTETTNYSLEKASHMAHHRWWATFGIPMVYVWCDFRCNYITDLKDEHLHAGAWLGRGSGTPFWLIPKAIARPFIEVFYPAEGGVMDGRLFAELDAQTYDDTLFVPNVGIDMEDECRCFGCGAYTVNPVLHVNPDSGDYECGEQYA